jgi:hypothetical protein
MGDVPINIPVMLHSVEFPTILLLCTLVAPMFRSYTKSLVFAGYLLIVWHANVTRPNLVHF